MTNEELILSKLDTLISGQETLKESQNELAKATDGITNTQGTLLQGLGAIASSLKNVAKDLRDLGDKAKGLTDVTLSTKLSNEVLSSDFRHLADEFEVVSNQMEDVLQSVQRENAQPEKKTGRDLPSDLLR